MPRIRVNPSRNGRNAGYWRRPPHDPRGERGEVERAFEKEYGTERGKRIYFATETQRAEERARQRNREAVGRPMAAAPVGFFHRRPYGERLQRQHDSLDLQERKLALKERKAALKRASR